MAQFSPKLFT